MTAGPCRRSRWAAACRRAGSAPNPASRRVFVRQSPAIESTYYMIVRAMRNPKIRRKIIFPVGLALVVFSALFLINPAFAPAIVGLTIGLYLLLISLPFSSHGDVIQKSTGYYGSLRRRFVARDFSPIFNLVAFIVVLLGIGFGIDLAKNVTFGDPGASVTQMIVLFLAGSLWWFMVAILTFESGNAVTAYLQKGRAPKHTLIVAGAFLAIGIIVLVLAQILGGIFPSVTLGSLVPLMGVILLMAILVMISGAFTYREREERPVEDGWRH